MARQAAAAPRARHRTRPARRRRSSRPRSGSSRPTRAAARRSTSAKRVEARSGGALTRRDRARATRRSLPANETRLARDVRAGDADFGILPARAWPAAGVAGVRRAAGAVRAHDYDVAGARSPARPARALNAGARARRRRPALRSCPRSCVACSPSSRSHGARAFRGLRIRHLRQRHHRRRAARRWAPSRSRASRPTGCSSGLRAGPSRRRRDRGGDRCSPTTTGAPRTTSPPTRCSTGHRHVRRLARGVEAPVAEPAGGDPRAPPQDTVASRTAAQAATPRRLESLCRRGVRVTDAERGATARASPTRPSPCGSRCVSAPATADRHAGARGDARRGPDRCCRPPTRALRARSRAPARPDDAAKLPEGVYVTRVMPGDHDAAGDSYIGPERGYEVDDAAEGRQVEADRRSGARPARSATWTAPGPTRSAVTR